MQAAATKLGIAIAEKTDEELTAAIVAKELTLALLNSCTVPMLQVIADCLEMTYVYTNKGALVASILAFKAA